MDYSISDWTHPLLQFRSKSSNKMANTVDLDEMEHYVLSRQDLHCLQRYLYWSVKG